MVPPVPPNDLRGRPRHPRRGGSRGIGRRACLRAALACAGLGACSSIDLSLGSDPADAARAGMDADARGSEEGSSRRPFDVHFELTDGSRIDGVTVGCSGRCVDVQAVATGGVAPYRYRWEDGTPEPVRRLCPEETRAFGVAVTDSAATPASSLSAEGASGEAGAQPAPAVAATMVAQVETCADAGGGADAPDGACSSSTSFAFCSSVPDQAVNLARPLTAGHPYTLHITGAGLSLSSWQIDYWGTGESGCSLGERLGGFTNTTLATVVDLCVRPEGTYGRVVSHLAGPASPGLGFLFVSVCDGCADGGD